jgi:anti-sigma28 factor (negative regulator of flagellin synthesis)
MGGISGVGGVGGPAPERPADVRSREREQAENTRPRDGVAISADAERASEASRVVQSLRNQDEVRQERVEQARAALERGEYRDETVLREVAQRLLRLLE